MNPVAQTTTWPTFTSKPFLVLDLGHQIYKIDFTPGWLVECKLQHVQPVVKRGERRGVAGKGSRLILILQLSFYIGRRDQP